MKFHENPTTMSRVPWGWADTMQLMATFQNLQTRLKTLKYKVLMLVDVKRNISLGLEAALSILNVRRFS
jgi:hypothetical protein